MMNFILKSRLFYFFQDYWFRLNCCLSSGQKNIEKLSLITLILFFLSISIILCLDIKYKKISAFKNTEKITLYTVFIANYLKMLKSPKEKD